MLKKIFLALGILSAPALHAQPYTLSLRPVQGLSSAENEILASILANLFSKQKIFLIFPSGGAYEEPALRRDADYILRGRVHEVGEKKFFVLTITHSNTGETLSGAQRTFQSLEALIPGLPDIVRELSSPLPPPPAPLSQPFPADRVQRLFESGVEQLRVTKQEIPVSSNTVVLGFFGSPNGEKISLPFGRELALYPGFSVTPSDDPRIALGLWENRLAPLTNLSPESASKLGRMFNADFLLSGEITNLKYIKALKITLTHTGTLARREAGPWYFTDEKQLDNFAASAIGELMGIQTNLPWDIILARRVGNIHGLSLAGVLKNGVESRNAIGETPLIRAVRGGWEELVEALLNQGASPRAADYKGWTALHWAASLGKPDVLSMLIRAKAPLNARNSEGWTPLICASIQGRKENVILLLEAGARRSPKDKLGNDALRWAQIHNFSSIEEILKDTPREKL